LNCGERYEATIIIIAVVHTTHAVVKLKPEKKNGIETQDRCDADTVLYQMSYQANWEWPCKPVRGVGYKIIHLRHGQRYEVVIYQRKMASGSSIKQSITEILRQKTSLL